MDIARLWHKLTPDPSYVFQVRAVNSEGIAYGYHSSFNTFTTPSTGAPAIEGESVSRLTPADASLEAQINTEGLEASYEFHLITAPTCLQAKPPCERPQRLFTLPSGKVLGPLRRRA